MYYPKPNLSTPIKTAYETVNIIFPAINIAKRLFNVTKP